MTPLQKKSYSFFCLSFVLMGISAGIALDLGIATVCACPPNGWESFLSGVMGGLASLSLVTLYSRCVIHSGLKEPISDVESPEPSALAPPSWNPALKSHPQSKESQPCETHLPSQAEKPRF